MNSKLILLIFVIGTIVGIGFVIQPFDTKNKSVVSMERPPGGDFTMNTVEGPKKLSDYKGKLVYIYFGYTYCPDVCPTNLGYLSMAYRKMSQKQKDNLQILFVSVDPERDTPKKLQQYVDYFEANVIGLSTDLKNLADVARRYGVVYEKVADPNSVSHYAVDHTAFTLVVDQQGQLVEQLPHASSPEQFIKTAQKYIK